MSQATIKPDRSPVPTAAPVSSFHPVTFAVPDRIADLQLRVSAPATGRDLPVLLFPHGFGASDFIASMRGYGPLVDVSRRPWLGTLSPGARPGRRWRTILNPSARSRAGRPTPPIAKLEALRGSAMQTGEC